MNYLKIHDQIIFRAKNRNISKDVYTEKHHIHPICEGGDPKGEVVRLTLKEHRLIHKLRYKITGVFGNIAAFNWMTQSENVKIQNAKCAAKLSHTKRKKENIELYKQSQRKAGKCGGDKCAKLKIGIHKLTEEEKNKAREKGRKTLVENKIGMFSDEYREKHKLNLHKKIETPDGIFNSMGDVAKHYNICAASVTYRVKSESVKWQDWKYLKGDNNEFVG
jgi:hypothetical protein